MRKVNPHARDLRQNMTDAERKLWHELRGRRFGGWKFRRQETVGYYIVDFLCIEARLVIEVDGGQHGEEADRARTVFLERQGFRVLRFWNNEVLGNLSGVLQVIEAALAPSSKLR